MSLHPNRLLDELRVIEPDVKLCMRGVYIKVTEKSLTTKATTVQAAWIMWQFVSLVSMKIG
jgi:hypothetical protein